MGHQHQIKNIFLNIQAPLTLADENSIHDDQSPIYNGISGLYFFFTELPFPFFLWPADFETKFLPANRKKKLLISISYRHSLVKDFFYNNY